MIAPDEGGMIQKQKHIAGLHEPESILSKNKTRTGDSQASSSFTTVSNIKTNARFSCHVGVNKIKKYIEAAIIFNRKKIYIYNIAMPRYKTKQIKSHQT